MSREAVIVGAVRTPVGVGKPEKGSLSGVHPVDLSAIVLQGLVARTGIDPALVDDVIWGCVSQVGEQGVNVGRNAALAAGFPEEVTGVTVDRQCGSSQQAASFGAAGVIAGQYDIVIAGGVESMSRVPMFSNAVGGDGPFGPRMMALPCPANPNDTARTPSYSTGVMACAGCGVSGVFWGDVVTRRP